MSRHAAPLVMAGGLAAEPIGTSGAVIEVLFERGQPGRREGVILIVGEHRHRFAAIQRGDRRQIAAPIGGGPEKDRKPHDQEHDHGRTGEQERPSA